MNLLANAAQAIGSSNGTVTIKTWSEEDRVFVAVSDTGCGIDSAALGRIFDPFFTTKSVGDGTGLGLSISFGIIEDHGGSIHVESQPGNGTTFTVELPHRLKLQTKDIDPIGQTTDSHSHFEVQNAFAI